MYNKKPEEIEKSAPTAWYYSYNHPCRSDPNTLNIKINYFGHHCCCAGGRDWQQKLITVIMIDVTFSLLLCSKCRRRILSQFLLFSLLQTVSIPSKRIIKYHQSTMGWCPMISWFISPKTKMMTNNFLGLKWLKIDNLITKREYQGPKSFTHPSKEHKDRYSLVKEDRDTVVRRVPSNSSTW